MGWLLVRSAEHGARGAGRERRPLPERRARRRRRSAGDVLAERPPQHLLRTDGFAHVADIMVGSFYDPELDEGCAFEELISFHGGHRRPADASRSSSTRRGCPSPDEPLVGAAAVNELLRGWRAHLQGAAASGAAETVSA